MVIADARRDFGPCWMELSINNISKQPVEFSLTVRNVMEFQKPSWLCLQLQLADMNSTVPAAWLAGAVKGFSPPLQISFLW
jgi:hypothetical protein